MVYSLRVDTGVVVKQLFSFISQKQLNQSLSFSTILFIFNSSRLNNKIQKSPDVCLHLTELL